MRGSHRFFAALGAAAGLHLFVLVLIDLWCAPTVRAPHPLVDLRAASGSLFVDLDQTGPPPGSDVAEDRGDRASGPLETASRGKTPGFAPPARERGAAFSERVNADTGDPVEGGEAGTTSLDGAQAYGKDAPALPSEPERDGVARRLSLDDLGLTGGIRNDSLAPARKPEDLTTDAEARLETAMTASVMRRDQELGLHGAGPILNALRDGVARSTTAINSRAVFSATVGTDGRITDLEIVESASARAAWEVVIQQVRALLGGRVLRVPKTGRGVSFMIEVVSRESMPSGADPGLGVSLAGIPVKQGKGKKSAKVEIFAPPS